MLFTAAELVGSCQEGTAESTVVQRSCNVHRRTLCVSRCLHNRHRGSWSMVLSVSTFAAGSLGSWMTSGTFWEETVPPFFAKRGVTGGRPRPSRSTSDCNYCTVYRLSGGNKHDNQRRLASHLCNRRLSETALFCRCMGIVTLMDTPVSRSYINRRVVLPENAATMVNAYLWSFTRRRCKTYSRRRMSKKMPPSSLPFIVFCMAAGS